MDSPLYDPFQHRVVEHPSSTFGASAHMIKALLGAGLFAMPLAIKHCGTVLGVIFTIIITVLCAHGMHLLVKVSRIMCIRTRQPMLGYEETTATTFKTSNVSMLQKMAPGMELFVNVALIGCYYGICCVYIVIMASSLKQELDPYIGMMTDIRLYILMCAIPLIIIGQIKALKYLIPFSTLGNVLILTCVQIVLADIFTGNLDFGERSLVPESFTHVPLFIGIVVFAIEPIGVTLVIENEMENPLNFTKTFGVINISCAFVGVLYSFIGLFGYARYGEEVQSSVTLNLPQGTVASIAVQCMMIICVFVSFGLNFYVATNSVWSYVQDPTPLMESIVRFWLVIACIGLALLVPNIGSFIGLVGALFLSSLGFVIPAILEGVALWPNDLGKCKWVLVKDILMILFGLIALVSGTVSSVVEIIQMYHDNPSHLF